VGGYEFDRLADRQGFAVVYPDGYRGNWNDCRRNATFVAKKENIDDVSFILALIDRFRAEHAVDAKQVYAFGYSNGGHMAFRLAMEAPDEIAAIAAMAASLPTPDASSCPQRGGTSRVMLVNGTEDPINPYQGGLVTIFGLAGRGTVMSSEASARTFAERNGITTSPIAAPNLHGRPNDPTWVESLTWSSDGKPVSRLYTVYGGGHVIPQQAFRFRRLLGRTTTALNAPSEAVGFCRTALVIKSVVRRMRALPTRRLTHPAGSTETALHVTALSSRVTPSPRMKQRYRRDPAPGRLQEPACQGPLWSKK
jgi:polyhydroxybutyrate depolymerase